MRAWGKPSTSRTLKSDETKDPKIIIREREKATTNLDVPDVDDLLEKICDEKQVIVSFRGSSQYGDKLGNRVSASTCGLAALNFARKTFQLEREENMLGLELLNELLSRKTIEEITSICDYWKSDSHLEIEELLKVPIFRNTLSLQSCTYSETSKQRFYDLLRDLEVVSSDRSVVVIITRPPEIIACLRTHVAGRDVYVTFDSHPRPSHPDGLGFIVNSNIKMAASYLSELLSFDESLLKDPSLQWQAQLLGYFSGHILLPLEQEPPTTEILFDSSMILLSSYADVAKEKSQVSELRRKVGELERQQQSSYADIAKEKSQVFELRRKVEELERQQRFMEEKVKNLETRRRQEHEEHQETVRSREREREKYQSGAPLQSRYNPFRPPPTFSSFPSSHQYERVEDDLGSSDWQNVNHLVKKDKGKGRLGGTSAPSFHLNGLWGQNYGAMDLGSRQGNFGSPPSSPKNRYTIPPRQNSAMPGGLSDPVTAVSGFDRDIAVALELQQQYEAENRQLASQKEMLERMMPTTFECSICFDEHSEDSVARIDGCDHSFCRDCLRGHAKAKIAERRFPIFCPLCATEKDKGKPGVVDEIAIQQIGVSDEDYKIFEELQITSFCIPLHCRRCTQTMFVDRQELQETKIITCPWPRCQFVWCKACQQEVEVGGPQHSCDGSSELNHLMKQRGWKTCPGCSTPVQKSEGCNHMTCITPACNTHFCYVDGEMIVKGGTRAEIQTAMNTHYRKCKLFDYR